MSPAAAHDVDTHADATARLREPTLTRIVSGICLVAFGYVILGSLAMPPPFNPADVGAGRFPLIASVGGALSCLYLLAASFRQGEPAAQVQVANAVGVALTVLVLIAYCLLMPLLGFYLTSLVAIPALMGVAGERRPLALALGSAGFCAAVYLLFQRMLDVPLP